MKVLAVDTTSQYGSIAVVDSGKILSEYTVYSVLNQQEHLLKSIDKMLLDIGLDINHIDLFAVVRGPGSFTGIRVGIATIQGLSFSLGKPVWGISSLYAMALGCSYSDMPICAVIDARQSEVYAGAYTVHNNTLKEFLPEGAYKIDILLNKLSGKVLFVGDDIVELDKSISISNNILPIKPIGSTRLLRASVVAELAEREMTNDNINHIFQIVTPLYCRNSFAELKLAKSV